MKTRLVTLFIPLLPVLITVVCVAACTAPPRPIAPAQITLVADGARTPITTDVITVRDVLEQANISLQGLDRVRPSENTAITDGMIITVTRVLQFTETQTQTVPFTQRTLRDTSLPAGQSKVLQPGRNGTTIITYRVTLEDGQQTEYVEIRRDVIEPPVPQEIVLGIEGALNAVPITGTLVYLSGNNAFVIRQATGNRRALTTGGDLDGRVLALSPDGRWLLYSRAPTQTVEGGPINSLWVVDTRLANAAPKLLKTPGVIWAAWSPGGNSMAYSTATATNSQPSWRAANDLWIADLREGSLGTPTKIVEPSIGGAFGWWGANYGWSPDGQAIAIGSTDRIDVVDVRTRKPITLTTFTAYNTFSNWAWTPQLSWTPDSKFVVAVLHGQPVAGESAESSPAFEVWTLAADGSLQVMLANRAGMWAAPRVLGQSIFYGRAQAPYDSVKSQYDLFRMDRDGSNSVQFFPTEGKPGLAGQPDLAVSPDGTQMVIVYQRDLYLINLVTGTAQPLTNEANYSSPRWAK